MPTAKKKSTTRSTASKSNPSTKATGTGNKPRYEITRNMTNRKYSWTLIASNGKPLASSEGYTKKSDALRTITRHKDNVRRAVLRDLTA
jgi:uncharacterized protein YegP (UPF0339 family)